MKNLKMMFALGSSVLMLAACGSNNPSTTAATAANSCSVGTVFYNGTCLPQGNCQYGQGMYNGTCVTGSVNNNPIGNNSVCSRGPSYSVQNTGYTGYYQGQTACQVGYILQGNLCVCQNVNNNNYNNGAVCSYGMVNTVYGCMPQANCPQGQALYNGACIVGSGTGYNNGYNYNGGYNYNYNYNYNSNTGVNCPMGTFSTPYGCTPQANCPQGQAFYNGQCKQLIPAYGAGFQFYFGW